MPYNVAKKIVPLTFQLEKDIERMLADKVTPAAIMRSLGISKTTVRKVQARLVEAEAQPKAAHG